MKDELLSVGRGSPDFKPVENGRSSALYEAGNHQCDNPLELRARLMDTGGAFWKDHELQHTYDARKTIHGVIATCMKQLAMSPATARRWERHGVRYTHYDYESMAKFHSGLAKHELEKGK